MIGYLVSESACMTECVCVWLADNIAAATVVITFTLFSRYAIAKSAISPAPQAVTTNSSHYLDGYLDSSCVLLRRRSLTVCDGGGGVKAAGARLEKVGYIEHAERNIIEEACCTLSWWPTWVRRMAALLSHV